MSSQDLKLFFLVAESSEGGAVHGTLKGLVHDRRSADPHAVHLFGCELTHLLEDELFIPAFRVDLLLGQPQVELKVPEALILDVFLKCLKQTERHRVFSGWVGDVQNELESIDIQNLVLVSHDSLGDLHVGKSHLHDQVHEHEHSCSSSECNMDALRLDHQSFTHRSCHFVPCLLVVKGCRHSLELSVVLYAESHLVTQIGLQEILVESLLDIS